MPRIDPSRQDSMSEPIFRFYYSQKWPKIEFLYQICGKIAQIALGDMAMTTRLQATASAKRRTTPPEPGDHEPGGTVILSGDGSRMAHLLCAKVVGDTWLCHRGSFLDGALNTSVPLSEHDLVGASFD